MPDNFTDIPLKVTEELKGVWRNFKQASGELRRALINDERAGYSGCIADLEESFTSPHSKAASVFTDWEREEGPDPKRSNITFGVIVVSPETHQAIQKLNQIKASVIEVIDKFTAQNEHTIEAIKASAGLSRLHYYKVRRIAKGVSSGPYPESVKLSIEQKVDVERRTVDECMADLESFGLEHTHIQVQIDKLSKIPRHEALAYVFVSQGIRCVANITHPRNSQTGKREHSKIRSVMPFYVVSSNPAWAPAIKLPRYTRLEDRVGRRERSDRKIDPEPFLPTIHIHRYL